MAEVPVTISVEGFFLEALYDKSDAAECVIVCHPHPLYGGSMDNNVVVAMQRILRSRGWGTLRFNFRGVGGSGGSYSDGNGEVRDVMAVASYLTAEGTKKLHLSGYSFGAWIALKAANQGLKPTSVILVSPPLDLLDFSGLRLPPAPCLIVLGDRDTFCVEETLHRWLGDRSRLMEEVKIEIIPGCDHFYWGKEELLSASIFEFVQRRL